ncbi:MULTISPECIES: hypothetical protein [Burkholderia]|uniref:hypothetical protein n=1 Tax=Burkholderia TaxID=32008 RepID=UPI0015C5DC96|nr:MULTISPECIES: hypothetical protein [Burkholderia]EKS9793417.1 hypothetical protein [Burkholderia cepacia]EKS9801297.1 hypothetical protein [Burkholderia cepacia]EKS9816720.1 hypothetical protein [Burkholderia cepacia]EKS9824858.1 hypothetical protein [Burkholderia cepacia]EKS9853850.1 hypothetical protein [Burkholderia cepacia]
MRVILSPCSVPARFERRVDATLPPRDASAITRSDETANRFGTGVDECLPRSSEQTM